VRRFIRASDDPDIHLPPREIWTPSPTGPGRKRTVLPPARPYGFWYSCNVLCMENRRLRPDDSPHGADWKGKPRPRWSCKIHHQQPSDYEHVASGVDLRIWRKARQRDYSIDVEDVKVIDPSGKITRSITADKWQSPGHPEPVSWTGAFYPTDPDDPEARHRWLSVNPPKKRCNMRCEVDPLTNTMTCGPMDAAGPRTP
jgi:hypothetical protein